MARHRLGRRGNWLGMSKKTIAGMMEQDHQVEKKEDDWATHIFREHNKEADARGEKGTRGMAEDWEDKVDFDWSVVSGICGFWVAAVELLDVVLECG